MSVETDETLSGYGSPVDFDEPLTSFDGEPLDVAPDVVPAFDPVDVDPLFSSLTGKTYKTERGKRTAETRFRNRGNAPASSGSMSSRALKSRLQQTYEMVGTVVGMMLSPDDGQVIIDAAPGCAEAVAEWAESDPRVKAALERMMTGSVLTKVMVAHAPIALGIMGNHGVNPLSFLSRSAPDGT